MDLAAKKKYVLNYESKGGEEFYRSLLRFATQKLADDKAHYDLLEQARKEGKEIPDVQFKGPHPVVILLERYGQFLTYYRREKLEVYREIAFHFRRAANKVYRLMLKQNLIRRRKDLGLLNLVG